MFINGGVLVVFMIYEPMEYVTARTLRGNQDFSGLIASEILAKDQVARLVSYSVPSSTYSDNIRERILRDSSTSDISQTFKHDLTIPLDKKIYNLNTDCGNCYLH